jgi:hypothetical protein
MHGSHAFLQGGRRLVSEVSNVSGSPLPSFRTYARFAALYDFGFQEIVENWVPKGGEWRITDIGDFTDRIGIIARLSQISALREFCP